MKLLPVLIITCLQWQTVYSCGVPEGCQDCRVIRRGDCTPKLRREKCRPRCNSQEVCCDNCCGGRSCIPLNTGVPEGCQDCRLIRRGDCTPKLRREKCRPRCNSQEVCCDNCCGGRSCIPLNTGEDPCEQRICTEEYDPVCSNVGRTYGNTCEFEFAKLCDDPSLEIDYPGECDPCALVLCAPLECDLGFILDFNGEGCCPARCVPDCSAVLCLVPNCPEDSQIVDPEQPCCRICETEPDPCEPQACILLYDPICGSDGVTYGNQCQFDFAKRCNNPDLEIDHRGECEPDPCEPQACILLYDPICGSDGVTYGNQCQFDFAKRCNNPDLEIDHPGECDEPDPCEPQACILLYDPICGSDGVTYGNQCQFDFVKRCNNTDLEIDHRGECEENPCDVLRVCTLEYNPVCGSNGVTYGNRCQFDAAAECIGPSLTIVKNGRCDIPEECIDCALVDVLCTDEKRILNCDCRSDEVCCDDCCGGKVCQPRNDEKDGTCPPRQLRACILGGPDDVPGCESDANCKGRQKCCPGVCNSTCQDPVEDDPCRDIICDIPLCPPGWALNYDGPGCCPGCIDCRLVRCARPVCPEGSEIVDPEEGCCPVCSEIDETLCPDGSNPVNCFVRPCQVATCVAYPDATCSDNYCGGCIADWYVDGELVDCNVCSLPLDSGPCLAAFRRWGFRNGRCEEFTYGGCAGNANNFQTLSECEDTCGGVCSLPIEPGPCRGYLPRWGFQNGRCEKFIYGGCRGNANRFPTEEECEEECGQNECPDGSPPVNCLVSPCETATCAAFPEADCVDNFCGGCNADWFVDEEKVDCDTDVCSLPIQPGPCRGSFPRWAFQNGRCEEFIYGGCEGNGNQFLTEAECVEECGQNVCSLPVEPGPCKGYFPKWGFQNGRCAEFIYGGCEGNANRFPTEADCVEACGQNVCSLPVEPGPCKGYFPKWGFQNGSCEEFIYGGCEGNANRFPTEAECVEECGQNVCSLPIETGPCDAYVPSWGFQNGRCEEFIYGGCDGNANRFPTEAECVEECGQNVCSLPVEPGPCKGYFRKWGFQNGRCEEFIYGGCEGNANRFPTEADCVEACGQNVCQLPLVTGPCEALIPRWGFRDDECVEFTYGGCQGNANNFESLAECIDECGPN